LTVFSHRWAAVGFGEPIVIGGMTIRTCDYVAADLDGAVIIPQEIITEVSGGSGWARKTRSAPTFQGR
jgi:regulator of RNase E activity RraA